MDTMRYIAGIVLCLVFYMILTGFWMKIAAFIGNTLGISRFLFWMGSKLKLFFQ